MTALGSYPLVARACIGISTVLVATSVATHDLACRLQVADPDADVIAALAWLDVNAERNVPTAWSTLLLLAAAVTCTSRGSSRPLSAWSSSGRCSSCACASSRC